MTVERKRRALGKGLSSLIPDAPSADPLAEKKSKKKKGADKAASTSDDVRSQASRGEALEVPLGEITPNPHQPRREFDEREIESLADSIRSSGVLQPLLVRREPDGGFTLIAGERRLRASKLAGLETVPVVVKAMPDSRMLEAALIENIQRDDLNPIDTARAFRTLVRELGLTQAEVAARVGKPRSTVANFLRLLDLPIQVQNLLEKGELDMGHGRALAGLDRAADQAALAEAAARERWSVRQVEEKVRRKQEGATGTSSRVDTSKAEDPNVAAAEGTLSQALEARVRIHAGRSGKGRIEIRFSSDEELERLYRVLLRSRGGSVS